MTAPQRVSRRGFLQTSVAIMSYLTLGGEIVEADDKNPKKLADVFKGIKLTDQYGKGFDPTELFKDRQCLVLFGYGGCPLCEEISNSVAAIQQELVRQGKEVPIVVVSVQPEQDRYVAEEKNDDGKVTKENPMKSYVAKYYEKGVKQFQKEILPRDTQMRHELGKKSYDENADKEQSSRILHVVCPPTAKDAQELERRLGLIFNPNSPKQHSAFITLADEGEVVTRWRGLNAKQQAPANFTGALAKAAALQVHETGQSK